MSESYVWTEREQVDNDLLCPNCNTINEPHAMECESCGETMLTDEDSELADDDIDDMVDTEDGSLAEAVSSGDASRDTRIKQQQRSDFDALYGELIVLKAGLEVWVKSCAVMASWGTMLFLVYKIYEFFGITGTLELAVGALVATFCCIWSWGIGEEDGWVFTV